MSAPYGPEVPGYQHFAYPMAPVATPGPAPRPRQVTVTFLLALAGSALFLIFTVVALATSMDGIRVEARDQLLAEPGGFTEQDVRNQANVFVFVWVFVAVLVTAPFITFGALLLTGRNWTRVLLTVITSIGGFLALFMAVVPPESFGLPHRLLALEVLGVSVAMIVLLFSRPANRYFAGG